MGIALEKDISVQSDILVQPKLDYSSKENWDVQIIKTQNKLLKTELSTLNKSRYLPSLQLIASYGATGFGYDKKPNDFLNFYRVGFAGVQFNYSLFNGTVTQRKVNQKKLEINNNELQSQLISDKNSMEIENANRQRIVAQKTITNTQEQIDLAEAIYKQTTLQQKQGTASLSDILLADHALLESQQNYLSALIDYLKADLELKKLTGNISPAKN